jgi:hypothetical protein
VSAGATPNTYAPPGNQIYLDRAIAIHCVDEAPGASDFAPPYCGTKKIRTWSAGLLDNLPTALAGPSDMGSTVIAIPAETTGTPTPTNLAAKIAKLQLDHGIIWSQRPMHPYYNMRDYGRELARDWADAMLMACTDDRDKALVQHVVQLGIDLYGVYEAGGFWPADGGHNIGRKAPIMYAGTVLDVAAMKNIGFTSNRFHEDGQFFYNASGDADWRVQPGRTDGLNYEGQNRATAMAHAMTVLHLAMTEEWGNDAYFEYLDDARTAGYVGANTYQENVLADHWSTLYTAAGIGPRPNPVCRIEPGFIS